MTHFIPDSISVSSLPESRADARETVWFHESHVIRSPPMKHMKSKTLTIGINNEIYNILAC